VKHIPKKKRDAILAKEGVKELDPAYVAAGLIYDIGAFFPHDVGHAVGAGLVKKSIHLFVKHILGTTGRKDLDRRMKPPNFEYPPYFPTLPSVSHHYLQYSISQAVHFATLALILLALSFTETSIKTNALRTLIDKGVAEDAQEVVKLVLDYFHALAEAISLWFSPSLEFPNDYLELERLGFDVGEKMLRVRLPSLLVSPYIDV
jgi:hypothetical protein